MFRSKRDVDRHVQEISCKVKNETERNLRFYNVAKLYFNVGDFDSAQHYVRCYLSVRPDVAGAHKLLAQALEQLKQKDKALDEYKCSLKLESRQPDVVLKVCELIVEMEVKLDSGEARYWKERVEEVGETHPTVFKFKEHLIKMEGGSGDHLLLEQLVKQEIDARPSDAAPRIRLLQLYLDSKRSIEAYKYAVDVELCFPFHHNIQWYSCLVNVFKAVKEESSLNKNWQFYLNSLCVLDRYVLLSLRENQGRRFTGNADPLYEFDQLLFQADQFSKMTEEPLLKECVRHMSGQLCFHLATAILSAGKQSRVGWKEYTPSAFAVLSLAWKVHVVDPLSWSSKEKDLHQRFLKVWQKDGAFRCSQAGHVLLSLPHLQKRTCQLSKQGWREKILEKVFSGGQSQTTSFFVNHDHFADIPVASPTMNSISGHDQLSQQHQPDSLHFLVWLGLRNVEKDSKKISASGPVYIPSLCISQNFTCHIFEKLKLTSNDTKSCGVETLSKLDVDSFLFASVFCAAAAQKDLQNRGLVSEDRPSVLPVDLTESLCTTQQAKWWSSSYRLLMNSAGKDLGEIRMTVQRGLEVIRVIGNHGMDVQLVVLLAKHFSEKAALLSQKGAKKDIQAISDRAFMYWNYALASLEKLEKNQTIRLPENRIFSYVGPDLSTNDIKMLIEEGRFFIGCRFMRDEQFEKAIEIFQQLKSPHASFYQGLIFKKLADAEVDVAKEERTSEMRSKHVILLLKSRSAFDLTLDRLRAPHVDSNHPLNAELPQHLQEVEDRLSHLVPDMSINMNRNASCMVADEGYLQSGDLQNISCTANASAHQSMLSMSGLTNGHSIIRGWTSTPVKSRFDPDHDAPLIHDSYPMKRTEARPSPERLDAQMRRMTISNESLIQNFSELNRQMLESNNCIVQALEKSRLAVEDLKSQVEDLRREVGRLKVSGSRSQPQKNGEFVNVFPGDEDYNEELDLAASQMGSLPSYSYSNPPFDIRSSALIPQRPLPASQMLPQAFFPQSQVSMYQSQLASFYGLNYGDGQTGTMPSVLPAALPSISGTLPGALPKEISPAPAGGAQVSNSSSAPLAYGKGAPLTIAPAIMTSTASTSVSSNIPRSQPLPVNVVITSSDVMPTQAPAQQPTLSVTIPPQHRHASVLAAQGKPMPVTSSAGSFVEPRPAPHNFQILMPPQANIPTSESLEKSLSPLKPVITQALLTNVPTPLHSAISASKSKEHMDSISGDDSLAEDSDYNACPDFKPLIPLPEEIIVTTGEEDEMSLFECRAKLYRFVDREWKERGVGIIKILKNKNTGKPRILMRRDQVHKICANHFISPEIELALQFGSDRAWTWVAQDFADQQVQVEKLCARFKTVEDAASFKEAFDKARELSKLCVTPGKDKVQQATSSKLIADSKLNINSKIDASGKVELGGFSFTSTPMFEPVDVQKKAVVTNEEKHASPPKPSPFAGFSFPSSTSKEDASSPQQKPSPFAEFFSSASNVFGKAVLTSSLNSSHSNQVSSSTDAISKPVVSVSEQNSTSTFGSSVAPDVKESSSLGSIMFGSSPNIIDFATLASQTQGKEVGKKDPNFKGFEGAGSMVFGAKISHSKENVMDKENCSVQHSQSPSTGKAVTPSKDDDGGTEAEEDFEPTATFKPVIPLPNLVETRTGEEGEEILFEERARLLRFDTEIKEWKERGVGNMKVLKDTLTGKVRLLMRREQVLKVCCNHLLSKDIEFQRLTTSDKAVTWSAPDFAEGEVRTEVFALRFKSTELMLKFKHVVEEVQKELRSTCQVTPSNGPTAVKNSQQAPLSELFKPKAGSWECNGCLTRNDSSLTACPCCQTVKPGCEKQVSETKAVSSPFTFGIKPENQVGDSSTTGFKFSNLSSSNATQPSLAEMFKPKAGSWECKECYTRNDVDLTACVACSTVKPGKENDSKVPTNTMFNFGDSSKTSANYTFGIPNPPSDNKAFCFGSVPSTKPETTSTFVFGAGPEVSKPVGFNFSTNSDSPLLKQGFTFGNVSSSSEQSFGSPHKFDFKMKDKSPSKAAGCSSGAEDSDEVAEEDNADEIHFQPVIPLPDKVPVCTGEEDETVRYSHRAKLFRFVERDWKERGIGEIKILKHNTTQKVRLLMRREQVLKICLNHFITGDLELHKKDDKTWIWGAQDFSEGVVATEQFACRFKNADIAADFKKAVEDAKAGLPPSPSQEIKSKPIAAANSNDTSVSSAMKNFTFKLPHNAAHKPDVVKNLFGASSELQNTSPISVNDEIQVVYEAGVTEEERAAALKLKLPENFYLYKNAPPCVGCPGCEEDSDSEQKETKPCSVSQSSVPVTAAQIVSSITTSVSGTSSLFGQTSFSSPSTTSSIFGGSGNTLSSGGVFSFGKSPFGTSTFDSSAKFSNTSASLFSMSGSSDKEGSKSGTNENVPFLPVDESVSFSKLAATSPSNTAFKSDPDKPFSFAGAGSKVFGVSDGKTESTDNAESSGDEGAAAGGEIETHDPHYEPIISLPDMVEVRTGEEEEEKIFCQRAKLYRYDSSSKEWKERGIGDMKILKHPENGTYRFLLRREQVHKVVLNQRIDASITLKPLTSSDKAWCWGGMNYAEEDAALEELAVKFKHVDHFHEFAEAVKSCQKTLVSVHPANNDINTAQAEPGNAEEEEDNSEDGSYSDGDEEEVLLEENILFSYETESSGDAVVLGPSILRVTQCPTDNEFETYWIEVVDGTEKFLCRMPILGESEVKREKKRCIWKGADMSEIDEGIEKTFIAEFSSERVAENFQDMFYRLGVEMVSQTYTHVEEIED